jgi:hypothetical protein
MSSKRSKEAIKEENEDAKRIKKMEKVAKLIGHGVQVVSWTDPLSSGQQNHSEEEGEEGEEGLSNMGSGGEMDSRLSSPRRETLEEVEFVVEDEANVTLYTEAVQVLYSENRSQPPFLGQAPANDIECVAFALPGWDEEKKTICLQHFYVAGFARVAVHAVENSEDEEKSSFMFFCNCCEEGKQAWHEVELFHDECGGCTLSSSCIHARYLEILVAHWGGCHNLMLYHDSTRLPGMHKLHTTFLNPSQC